MTGPDIWFVRLGLKFYDWHRSFTLFGIEIYYYGVVIALSMLLGMFIALRVAKRTGQNREHYYELAIWGIILSVIGARIYYVVFAWDHYKDDLLQIFNLRAGGLAIYGGVITAFLTMLVYAKRKKLSFKLIADTVVCGLIAGQCTGRFSNFFNMEAFGGYTDGFLAMALNLNKVSGNIVTQELLEKSFVQDGITYIQVHPTFLYESLWSLGTLILLLIVSRKKKFDGEIALLYLIGYGSGRVWIEGLRTDQLKWFGTDVAVSQVLSGILVVAAAVFLILGLIRTKQGRTEAAKWLSREEAAEKAAFWQAETNRLDMEKKERRKKAAAGKKEETKSESDK